MTLPLDDLVKNPHRVNEQAQALDWDELLLEYERALDDDAALLLGLSDVQLRFKPGAQDFSIAEVLTHVLHSDQLFWRWIKLLLDRRRAEIDPAALVSGDGAQADQSGAAIATLIETVRLIARGTIDLRPDSIDLRLTAPHPYFGELNAKGWIRFMALHHGMHLRQCEAVIDTPGFPRSTSRQSLTAEEYLQPRDRKTWLQQDAGGKKQEAGSKKQDAGGKKQDAGGKKQDAGSKKPTAKKTPAGKRVVRR